MTPGDKAGTAARPGWSSAQAPARGRAHTAAPAPAASPRRPGRAEPAPAAESARRSVPPRFPVLRSPSLKHSLQSPQLKQKFNSLRRESNGGRGAVPDSAKGAARMSPTSEVGAASRDVGDFCETQFLVGGKLELKGRIRPGWCRTRFRDPQGCVRRISRGRASLRQSYEALQKPTHRSKKKARRLPGLSAPRRAASRLLLGPRAWRGGAGPEDVF